MTVHIAKYPALSADGTSVQVPIDISQTVTRNLNEGEKIFLLTDTANATNGPIGSAGGSLQRVQAGALVDVVDQPEPGDLVVFTCPASDIGYSAGQIGVIGDDGRLYGSSVGLTNFLLSSVPPPS